MHVNLIAQTVIADASGMWRAREWSEGVINDSWTFILLLLIVKREKLVIVMVALKPFHSFAITHQGVDIEECNTTLLKVTDMWYHMVERHCAVVYALDTRPKPFFVSEGWRQWELSIPMMNNSKKTEQQSAEISIWPMAIAIEWGCKMISEFFHCFTHKAVICAMRIRCWNDFVAAREVNPIQRIQHIHPHIVQWIHVIRHLNASDCMFCLCCLLLSHSIGIMWYRRRRMIFPFFGTFVRSSIESFIQWIALCDVGRDCFNTKSKVTCDVLLINLVEIDAFITAVDCCLGFRRSRL